MVGQLLEPPGTLFASPLDRIRDAYFELDREFRFLSLNRRALDQLRKPERSLLGRVIWDCFPEAAGTIFQRAYEWAMGSGISMTFEAFYPPFGSWYEVRVYPSLTGISVYFDDTTADRQTRTETERARTRHRALLDALPFPIAVLDAEWRVEEVNHAWKQPDDQRPWHPAQTCARIGADCRRLLDTWAASAPHAGHLKAELAALTRGDATSVSVHLEFQRDDRPHVLRLDASALPAAADGGILVALHDETASLNARRADDELRRRVDTLTLELERSRRELLAKEEALRIVSHDLRNPLNDIMLLSQILQQSSDSIRADPAHLVEFSRRIEKRAAEMNRLVNDHLLIAKVSAGALDLAPRKVDVAAFLRDILEQNTPLATSKGVRLTLAPPSGPLRIRADVDCLRRVFDNLLSNAFRYTEPGGCVTIAARPIEGGVRFSVVDDGCGISPEELPLVFQQFWQAGKGQSGGAGLGLAIVRGIIEAHGGRVWAESELKKGTMVAFELPRRPPRRRDTSDDLPNGGDAAP